MSTRSSDEWRYEAEPKLSAHVREQLEQRRQRFADSWRRDPGREAALLVLLAMALASVFLVALDIRARHFEASGIQPQATFWMESAQRFRWVREVADGRAIPRLDTRVQTPDGYDPWSDTVLQEVLYGKLYRSFAEQGTDLASFVRRTTRIASASAILPVALLCFALTRRRDAALLGALLWAVALPVGERGTGIVLFREDLAVPVLLWHLAALAAWARRPRLHWALAAGLLLALALLLWKVISFYVLLLAAFLGTAHWLRRAQARDLLIGTLAIAAPVLAACVPRLSLRADSFATSTAMLSLVAVAGGMAADLAESARARTRGKTVPPPLVWLPLVLVLALALRLLLPSEQGYDHAWETILAKIRHLGVKPADPGLLSFHARHYWTGNYESPSLALLVRDWPLLLLVALPGFAFVASWWRPGAARRIEGQPPLATPVPIRLLDTLGPMEPLPGLASHFVLWLVVALSSSYLLFRKFTLFFAIPLVVLAALGFVAPRRARHRLRALVGAGTLAVTAQGFGLLPDFADLIEPAEQESWDAVVVHSTSSFDDLARALPGIVGPDEAVLASFVISPFVTTYLDRPTALHCFFEGDLPRRFQRVVQAAFGDEATLWQVAREYGARWYVHEAHHLLRTDRKMSYRYVADRLDWPHDSVLAEMSFAPELLHRFELAWQNDCFRVFRVLADGESPRGLAPDPRLPLWNRPLFSAVFGDPLAPVARTAGFPAAPSDLLYSTLWARRTAARAAFDPAHGRVGNSETERDLQEALRVAPYLADLEDVLADFYLLRERHDRAAEHRIRAESLRRAMAGRGPFPEGVAPVPMAVRGD